MKAWGGDIKRFLSVYAWAGAPPLMCISGLASLLSPTHFFRKCSKSFCQEGITQGDMSCLDLPGIVLVSALKFQCSGTPQVLEHGLTVGLSSCTVHHRDSDLHSCLPCFPSTKMRLKKARLYSRTSGFLSSTKLEDQ